MKQKINKISQYCNVMEEIKKRTEVIRGFLSGGCYTLYMPTTLECMCIQLRKVLELIALASLVMNKKEYSKQHRDFHKDWNGGNILKKLETINPDFYPSPIKENPSSRPKVKMDLQPIKSGYLTKKDFVEVYGRCGNIAHADNPFGAKTDFDYYEKQIALWLEKIRVLLNSHVVRLAKDKNMYLFHRKENDGKAHGYVFTQATTARNGK